MKTTCFFLIFMVYIFESAAQKSSAGAFEKYLIAASYYLKGKNPNYEMAIRQYRAARVYAEIENDTRIIKMLDTLEARVTDRRLNAEQEKTMEARDAQRKAELS